MGSLKVARDVYKNIANEYLIIFGIYSIVNADEDCTFDRLVKECFTLFPKAFSFSRYPEWPDSLKFDRPLRSLRERGWIVGSAKTQFSLTRFGESAAKEAEELLKVPVKDRKTIKKPLRGVEANLIAFLKESEAFRSFLRNRRDFSITEMELRSLLRCTLETPERILRQNLQYSKNLAKEYSEKELLEFLEVCEQAMNAKEV
jgi:hypothetical protein